MGMESTSSTTTTTPPTVKAYLDDTYVFHLSGVRVVEEVVDDSSGSTAIIVDKTSFHPQGGGQPTDTGKCE